MDQETPNPFDLSGFGTTDPLGGLTARAADPGLPVDPAVLERNLVALCLRNRALSERLRSTRARDGLVFEVGGDGAVVGTLEGRSLASKRRALEEARALAEGVDPEKAAVGCVMGFALGHHVRALHDRLGRKSAVIAFEPDLGLLRAVLERVDHSAWLGLGRCVIVTDPDDAPGLTRSLHGIEGLLGLGVEIVDHPASKARLGDRAAHFGRTVGEVVRTTRTQLVTTMVHATVTMRNAMMNSERYAACSGVLPLKDACPGRVAVTVAAGPSLHKNLSLLAEPGVRERVVIIAAQTVLKPMLAAGIRPHFVTALDHHEISGRFYEGLTRDDVRGVRLVVEPKANPAILDAFPGEILCTQDKLLDELIGPDLARPMGELPSGATVAHLSYYLARYLGCDPVVMIGQDLAFSDHQYYAAGASIHRVWQGEIGPDRSLEAMEWERVVRMGKHLRRVTDQDGRTIYTDEQMGTYLAQFEADFQRDTQNGLRVIDATEGGARKRGAEVMTLRDALASLADRPGHDLPDTASHARDSASVRPTLRAHLDGVRGQSKRIAEASDEAVALLGEVLEHQRDLKRAGALIARTDRLGKEVRGFTPGFRLVEFVNQTGVFNRFRADRSIELRDPTDPYEKQRLRIDRDIKNIGWIADAARELIGRLTVAIDVLDGLRGKQIRDESEPDDVEIGALSNPELFVLCDPDRSGLGVRRDLGRAVWNGRDALGLTLERAARCASVRRVCVVTPDPGRTRALVERAGFGGRVEIEGVDPARWRARARAIGLARAGAAANWRGGVGQTTAFDEQLDPRALQEVMERRSVDAAAVIGADWSLFDPALTDALVERHREHPRRHQLTFTQAVPGIAGVVLGREAVDSLVELQNIASPLGTVGGLLGYLPVRPQADPVGKTLCLPVDPRVRDAGLRVVADCAPGIALVAHALEHLGDRALDSSAIQTVRALQSARDWTTPRTLVLELCSGRLASGVFGQWKRGGPIPSERAPVVLRRVHDLVREHTRSREDAVVVLDGAGDPLMHPEAIDIVRLCDELGAACVHLRTDLLREGVSPEGLIESGLGVLSVDVLATEAATYRTLTGVDRYEQVVARLGAISDARETGPGGLRSPWILPRITKCEATLAQMESFYNAWIMTCGAAAIDPVPAWGEDRIQPLPVPPERREQLDRETVRVRCDGVVCDSAWRPFRSVNVFEDGLVTSVRTLRKRQGVIRRIEAAA